MNAAPPEATKQRAGEVAWLTRQERGAVTGIRLVFLMARFLGRAPARLFLRVVALWYVLADRHAREASRSWLSRVYGRPARFTECYRHILCFARVTLDRVFLLMGAHDAFAVNRTGSHHLAQLSAEKRGAVLVGAHLGSFEAMRAGAQREQFPINIVGHFENARMINALLGQLNAEATARVIHVGNDPVGFATTVRERLEAGEMVAILADRVGLNDKHVVVRFMGEDAAFPTGPFLLAHALKRPVYLVFGLYFEPNRYELFCEPFAERVDLPRGERQAALAALVQRYAERLEHYARMAPDNWFNFYDFWKKDAA
jgi:predicted LPLAT superfamily acyltransferase